MRHVREQCGRRKHVEAGGCQLHGQGQPVQPDADFRNRCGIRLSQRERGVSGLGPLAEQCDRLIARQLLHLGIARDVRQREG